MESNSIITNNTITLNYINNHYRKPLFNINSYLYSLFGNNDFEMTNHITNMIYNSSTKFTLQIYYSKFGTSSGITTFMKYLELLFPNIIMEIPQKFIKDLSFCIKNIDKIEQKTILFIDNLELNDIDMSTIHILKNMNVNLVLIMNQIDNIEIYENSININIVQFPYKFVNRKVTSLEDINVKSANIHIKEELTSIIDEAKDYLLLFHRKNNSMIPIKKRKLYH